MSGVVQARDGASSSLWRLARGVPLLTEFEEKELLARWAKHQDPRARDRLLSAHLRLVFRIARSFRGYGLPLGDLVAEGNLGLVRAFSTFDTSRNLRFSTYAQWWVRAAMFDHVLRFSLPVTFGLSAGRKRLFFKLRQLKEQTTGDEDRSLTVAETARIADILRVKPSSVVAMERLLFQSSPSLDAVVGEGGISYGDTLADDAESAEDALGERQEKDRRRQLLKSAMGRLTPREQDIIKGRSLRETPMRLEDLAQRYGISRERVRQIEGAALLKLRGLLHAAPRADVSFDRV